MINHAPSPAEKLQILEFYAAAGIDLAVDDEAIDRLAAKAEPPPAPAPQAAEQTSRKERVPPAAPSPAPRAAATIAPDEAVMQAREMAASAPDLTTLEALLEGFNGCALKSTASRLVFADGNPEARIMIIGEAPGREEDEVGRPFVGRAGQLLDRMLSAIRLDRNQVYIANTVPWRPPGNRTPTPQEIAVCQPFLARQIALCGPDLIVTMGAPATQTLLNQKEGILRMRGRWFDYACGARVIPALATLHPAYLLRQPAQKALAWRDFRALQIKFGGLQASRPGDSSQSTS